MKALKTETNQSGGGRMCCGRRGVCEGGGVMAEWRTSTLGTIMNLSIMIRYVIIQ